MKGEANGGLYRIHKSAFRALPEQGDEISVFARYEIQDLARVWIALAEAEQELGLDITDEQLEELRAHKDDN